MLNWSPSIKGRGVLSRESREWRDFVVATTPSPWAIARPMLSAQPTRVVMVESLDQDHLDVLAAQLRGSKRVVGIGGGFAMDGAKHIASRIGATLIQVPTTSSNNAGFTRRWRCIRNGRRTDSEEGAVPAHVLVDMDLILRAPNRMNRAGLGEVLCSHSALFDWELAHRAGRVVDWDAGLAHRTRKQLQRLEDLAPALGEDDPAALESLLQIFEELAPDFLAFPRARFNGASEHLFAWCLEQRIGRRLQHGEAVCLGVLVMAHMQENAPDWAARIVQAGRVRFRPTEIGTDWHEVEDAVLALPDYEREVIPYYTVLDELAGRAEARPGYLKERFDRARAFVETL
jgi:glycerol dehydrogenase-like iron-containing ADH family enzyme